MTHARSSHQFASVLGPVLLIAALTFIVTGCTGNTSASTDTNSQSSSEMTDSMMPTDSTATSAAASSTPITTTGGASSDSAVTSGKVYTDGTYSATGNYRSPAGLETVEVSLTLKNDVITDATFVGDATAPRSKQMQGQFAAGYKEQVVGKSIDSLSLGVVNGSSLTGKGFMDAVTKIQAEAKAS